MFGDSMPNGVLVKELELFVTQIDFLPRVNFVAPEKSDNLL